MLKVMFLAFLMSDYKGLQGLHFPELRTCSTPVDQLELRCFFIQKRKGFCVEGDHRLLYFELN